MGFGAILSATLAVTALGFEDGTSAGFHSTGNARVRVVAGGHGSGHALELCDRDADWNSIELDLTGFAPAGSPCAFAAYVRQDTSDLASFDLSLKDDPDDGEARYPTVARCKARRGEWTLLKGTFPIGTGGTLPFVCRTDSTDAFRIDDVTVDCAAAYREDEPETSIPRLKDAFAVRGMTCGASVGDAVLGERTGARKRLLARHFHSLSPENQLKASFLLDRGTSAADLARYDENAALDFSAPRPWFEFARANGMRVSAQALVWFMLTPEWWFHVDYDTEKPLASRPLMLKRLEGYVRGVLGWCETNYPGLVRSWVVVNESVDGDATPRLHDDLFLRTIGEDYIERTFEFANRYRPRTDCVFLCNDSNLEGYPAKRDFLLDYLKRHRIIERKWVDGIGVQGHLKMDWPDAADIRSCCAAIRAAGLSVEVTELDVALSAAQIKAFGSLEEAFRRQAARYEEAVRAYSTAHISWWGLTDAYSWISAFYGERSFPLLFDRQNRHKPAFDAVLRALSSDASKKHACCLR